MEKLYKKVTIIPYWLFTWAWASRYRNLYRSTLFTDSSHEPGVLGYMSTRRYRRTIWPPRWHFFVSTLGQEWCIIDELELLRWIGKKRSQIKLTFYPYYYENKGSNTPNLYYISSIVLKTVYHSRVIHNNTTRTPPNVET